DNGDGTATFAGTPGLGDGGIATVTLIANDGTVDSQPRAYTIDVAAPRWGILNGVLAIAGSSGNDSIQAWQRGDQIRVVRNGQIKNFPVAGITVVEIYGLDGNDVLALNVKSMVGYAVGGAGNDTLTGGDEIDILTGGGGKDSLMGGGGNDRLNGHNGNDRIDGGAGNDRLYGGEGNDVLFGGDGADQFFGETGDDVLLSRDTFIDHLNGGDGADSAQVDASDIKDDLLTLLA
ncbi:MAG: serralysin, partial [Humisphaera sp.]|nr:serralysin [Humisphaera sp.]